LGYEPLEHRFDVPMEAGRGRSAPEFINLKFIEVDKMSRRKGLVSVGKV